MTIEDETGTANLIIFKNLFEKFRKEILHPRLLMVKASWSAEGEGHPCRREDVPRLYAYSADAK